MPNLSLGFEPINPLTTSLGVSMQGTEWRTTSPAARRARALGIAAWTVLPGSPALWTTLALMVIAFPAYTQLGR